MKFMNVTGFWKTNQIVTLGLFHFIGSANGYTLVHYTYTVPLLALVGWFASLEWVCWPCEFMTETVGPMEGATWKAWDWNSPQGWGDIY